VSSLKSVPVAHSRQSALSKLRAARAVLEPQTSSLHEDADIPASPGSSDSPPHTANRKTPGRKSTVAPKQATPSEMLVIKYTMFLYIHFS